MTKVFSYLPVRVITAALAIASRLQLARLVEQTTSVPSGALQSMVSIITLQLNSRNQV